MKRIFLIVIWCVTLSFSFAQDGGQNPADEALVFELLGNMRDFQYDGEDTQAQVEVKERKLKKALDQTNIWFKGKSITFQRVTLDDIIPEMVNDGFLSYKETGKYVAQYAIRFYSPLPFNYLTVKIVKIYPNENSVSHLAKESVTQLTGRVTRISYGNIINTLTLWID